MGRRADTQARRAARLPRAGNLGGLSARSGGVCHLCGTKVGQDEASRDHVLPVHDGGQGWKQNLALAHKVCNVARAELPIAESRAALGRWADAHPGQHITKWQCVEVLRAAVARARRDSAIPR